jgi:hypothetical protein
MKASAVGRSTSGPRRSNATCASILDVRTPASIRTWTPPGTGRSLERMWRWVPLNETSLARCSHPARDARGTAMACADRVARRKGSRHNRRWISGDLRQSGVARTARPKPAPGKELAPTPSRGAKWSGDQEAARPAHEDQADQTVRPASRLLARAHSPARGHSGASSYPLENACLRARHPFRHASCQVSQGRKR